MESFGNCRAMVIDDEPRFCDSVTETMQSWGVRVEGFTRPEPALEAIRANTYDVIVLDVNLGDVCGLDLISQMGNCGKIIIITGFSDKDTAIRALQLGAFDLIEKPFQNELLYHCLQRALSALENERKSKRYIDSLNRNRVEYLEQQRRFEALEARLLETNKALSVISENIEQERKEIRKRIAHRLKELIMPTIAGLMDDPVLSDHRELFDLLMRQIEDLTAWFASDCLLGKILSFTELRIASFIKNGTAIAQIAAQLHISEATVHSHRKRIRRKLNITDAKLSLRDFLKGQADSADTFVTGETAGESLFLSAEEEINAIGN
ncbi:MAG: DNA-binding response regulator [Syntrophobacteraceae bacterium]